MTGHVHAERRGSAGWLIIDHVAKRNALTTTMLGDLADGIARHAADDAIAALVIRGEGMDAFAAGADIGGFEKHRASADLERAYDAAVESLFAALRDCRKPVIAMIRGYCIGAGLAIALAADIRLADSTAVFAIPAARLGIGYPVDLAHALVDAVGTAHACELLFTGDRFSAADAERTGLINRVLPTDRLGTAVDDLVTTIARNAPLSVRAAKLAVRARVDAGTRPLAEAAVAACRGSADASEGPIAFRERRPPRFIGA